MSLMKRIANALTGCRNETSKPQTGQLIGSESLEQWRDYPADGLTPQRLVSVLRAADEGAIDQAMALYEQMEEKDAHLFSVARTRRLALTSLSWHIVSAADERQGVDRTAADEAAAYCREVLNGIDTFSQTLAHLALAIGRNIAVAENVWGCVNGELRLVDVAPVTYDRLTFDANGQLRILTEEDRFEGITLPPNKFVTHAPHCMSGHPMRGGLLRVSALAYLGKHFAMKDWMVFAEVFGMPVRIARYDPSATAEEKRELLAMLESLGSDAAGVFSKAVELQLLEAGHGKTPPPYEKICTFFNRELSKAWLGGTLAVDMSDTQAGRYTSGPKVHNEVRLDLRQDDIVREGRTVRRDILSPITRLKFGADVPVPFFRRQLDLPRDQKQLADILGKAVNELRLKVPARWAHDALGVPMAETEEDVVTGTVDT